MAMKIETLTEQAKKLLASVTGLKAPRAIGARKEGKEWVVTTEIIEKISIPDGMDILGVYDVRLDENGNLIGYQRLRTRKRVDTGEEGIE